MKISSKKIIILYNGDFYSFASFVLEDDGSLYISLLKKIKFQESVTDNSDELLSHGKPPEEKEVCRKISYHCKGEVHYEYVDNKRIFCDPIVNIESVNLFAHYILPSITYLDKLAAIPEPTDYVIEVSQNSPCQFNFFLAPFNTAQNNAIHYQNLFSFVINITAPIISCLKEGEDVFITPQQGKYATQKIDQGTAYTMFHQKINNKLSSEPVLYSPNKAGVWKIISSRPMRTSPLLTVNFKDKNKYQVQKLPEENVHKAKYVIRFKVKGTGGNINTPVEIFSFTLDSRLGVY